MGVYHTSTWGQQTPENLTFSDFSMVQTWTNEIHTSAVVAPIQGCRYRQHY